MDLGWLNKFVVVFDKLTLLFMVVFENNFSIFGLFIIIIII